MKRASLLFLALLLSGCGLHGGKRAAAKHEGPTRAEPVEPASVVAPGIVEAWGGETALAPREPGWIAAILVVEGQTVTAGQLLARLDDEAQQAGLAAASADLREAEAALARTLRGATDEERRVARAEAAASDARAGLARSSARRVRHLGDSQAVPDAEVERAAAQAEAESSIAEADAARRRAVERGSRSEDRAAAAARVDAARARLRLAEAALARRQVVAPAAGTVLVSRFHAGEYVALGAGPLFELGDVSRLQVRLEVDEVDLQRVAAGATCVLYADDGTRLGDGRVLRLAPRMGRRGLPLEAPTARADVRVREVFVDAPAGLLPGMRLWGHVVPCAQRACSS